MKFKKVHKAINLREKDPYLAQESQKYDHPLPSREWIIELLNQWATPQPISVLSQKLDIQAAEYDFFERRLKAMARDGQILINRRGLVCIAEKLELIPCRIEAHKDGFGFAVPLNKDKQEKDFVLYEREMANLMHGDIVHIRPKGFDRRGRPEGMLVEIIERAQTDIVGRFYVHRGIAILEAEDHRIHQDILLTPESVEKLKPQSGQVILARIVSYPEKHHLAVAELIEILGNYADSGMEIEIAVRKHKLPHQFSEACLKMAKKIPNSVRKADWKGRIDLRDLPLLTIDGETSRDFDDAVFAEKKGRNFRLVVAIADVSHYVRPDDAIDQDAYDRATSVYFPRRVIPMLPENLSNGICSLNPDVERLCMVCDMEISYAGNIKHYQFYPAVMKSHGRLTYSQVWDYLAKQMDHPHQKNLNTLYQLFRVLHKKRLARGAMEFESKETQMHFNEQGKIERITPVIRNDAHKLIEECMLAANVCAADFLLRHQHPTLFRNHSGPTPEKLAALREQLALLGLHLGGKDDPSPKHYAELANEISQREDRELIQVMLLRSMQQAMYEPENNGHFGLAYTHYTHFTSPIRRYPDLMVHRAIKAVLSGQTYAPASWSQAGVHTSYCERRADDASRDVENWLKTFYMRDKVGEIFSGTISGVSHFGVFVNLDDIHIEGLIHISELGTDYFTYQPEQLSIVGERSGIQFKMGDTVVIKVARADLDSSKIDFILISGGRHRKKKITSSKQKIKHSESEKKAKTRSKNKSVQSTPSKKRKR